MELGEVIRKYRKEKKMTQEEMAGRLGVSAPAVNKWEKGNSFPDITLLAPIARLLGITTDTLLSYRETLTEQEIHRIIRDLCEAMQTEDYDSAFRQAEEKLQEYPNCDRLLFLTTQVLDSYRLMLGVEEPEKYDDKIYRLYVRCLDSGDYEIVQDTAELLFHFFILKKDYTRAQEYLNKISRKDADYKRMEALLYQKQGRTEEAYRLYEEIIFSRSNDISGALNRIQELALEENDIPRARMTVEKLKSLAEIMEMGNYQQAAAGLGVALRLKEKEETLDILEALVHSMKDMDSCRKSGLYSHMTFSDSGKETFSFMLQKAFENDEELDFVKDEERYERILKELRKFQK